MSAEFPSVRDAIDRAILGVLGDRGRISWSELGRAVHLSANAAAERVRKLEERGIIAGYAAVIDHDAVGRSFEAVVDVKGDPAIDRPALERFLEEEPEVVDAMHLAGSHDYLLQIRCQDAVGLDDLLMRLKREVGVGQMSTRVVRRRL